MKHRTQWNSLDNAAKMFAPTSSVTDPKVFRCSCELFEDVDPKGLQIALDETMAQLPYFRSTIKKGFFWHYLERCQQVPLVAMEQEYPCSMLYDPDRYGLLFRVTYHGRRINLEVFHALADGAGAFQFLQSMVIRYVIGAHAQDFRERDLWSEMNFSEVQTTQDGFSKYYSKVQVRRQRTPRAHQVKGERFFDFHLGVVEAIVPIKSVVALAKEKKATVTELLTALLILAIHEGMSVTEEKKPVVISVPVNLRKYFPTDSIRNFFGVILVSHRFSSQGKDLGAVLANVQGQFATQLTSESIGERMSLFATMENKLAAKLTPLMFKSPGLRIGNSIFGRAVTASLSNLGEIQMPEGFERYIRLFDVFSSTNKLHLCLCSYSDKLVLSYSSTLVWPEVQRAFIRMLSDQGIEVVVDTNLTEAMIG